MRGRPTTSEIRNHILEIVLEKKKVYGYELYKLYCEIFPKVHMRSIYYHLKKGVELGELELNKVENVKGDYSWGTHAQKIFYTLGSKAEIRKNKKVSIYLKNNTNI